VPPGMPANGYCGAAELPGSRACSVPVVGQFLPPVSRSSPRRRPLHPVRMLRQPRTSAGAPSRTPPPTRLPRCNNPPAPRPSKPPARRGRSAPGPNRRNTPGPKNRTRPIHHPHTPPPPHVQHAPPATPQQTPRRGGPGRSRSEPPEHSRAQEQDEADPPPAHAATASTDPTGYEGRPGDTLWDIAAAHLPEGASAADIEAAWPEWYQALQAAIGDNAVLILPGTTLHPPDMDTTGSTSKGATR